MPAARRLVRRLLPEWRLSGMSGTTELLVSELVTNAVQASGPGAGSAGGPDRVPMIALTLRLTSTSLVAEVWDPSPARPALAAPGPADDGGRGLTIVDFLADSWGHYAAAAGKVVWCELALPRAPGAGGS